MSESPEDVQVLEAFERSGGGARVRLQGQPVDGYPVLPPEAVRGSVLRITEIGEQILHRPCGPADAEFGTPELARLIDDMFATMYIAAGAGLAANQVDVDLRLFVYDCLDEDGVRHVGHILNPVIEEDTAARGRRLVEDVEGCLSVPGATMDVARPAHTVMHGYDKDGKPLTIEGFGYFARCLQHEADHLEGRLYVDRLAKRERKDALRQMTERRTEVFAKRQALTEKLMGSRDRAGEAG
ncbi:peptide deformylase [Kitasatospora sp. GP30]|uniref:peptide deformylase n=1 Tax=Kitasatospora sp. GP30 TaxID=3035084 RepID=UPI000C70178E|nr:peptide deformylase [Kitasatospora sp. GP30]MDH6142670.1 peptide deformylase [Kitasatospora sp. GP30]